MDGIEVQQGGYKIVTCESNLHQNLLNMRLRTTQTENESVKVGSNDCPIVLAHNKRFERENLTSGETRRIQRGLAPRPDRTCLGLFLLRN
jgi:hypothetical protein